LVSNSGRSSSTLDNCIDDVPFNVIVSKSVRFSERPKPDLQFCVFISPGVYPQASGRMAKVLCDWMPSNSHPTAYLKGIRRQREFANERHQPSSKVPTNNGQRQTSCDDTSRFPQANGKVER
jgi:hypothetical protein